MRNALNEVMRAAYIKDCEHRRAALEPADRRSRACFPPHPAEHRGSAARSAPGRRPTPIPEGNPISGELWDARQHEWLPSGQDRAFVQSLMRRVVEPGKFAGWIAPPEGGINNLGLEYEYVRAS